MSHPVDPVRAAIEHALGLRAQAGDLDAANELVERNAGGPVRVAKRFQHPSVPLEDLVQAGAWGMTESSRTWDPDLGTTFLSYAQWQMVKRVCEERTAMGYPVTYRGDGRRLARKLPRAQARLRDELRRDPTVPELAMELEATIEQVEGLLGAAQAAVSIHETRETDEGSEAICQLPETKPGADVLLEEKERRKLLDLWLSCLDKRRRDIVCRYHGLPNRERQTMGSIARHYGIDRKRVKQLLLSSERKLKASRHLELVLEVFEWRVEPQEATEEAAPEPDTLMFGRQPLGGIFGPQLSLFGEAA